MARRKSIPINRADKFLADTHFGHEMMISLRNKKLLSDIDHDEFLIGSWNSVVAPSDRVWHLGDFADWRMKPDRLKTIFERLNGRKNLLVGNHDPDDVLALDWEGIHRGPVHWKDQDTGLSVIGSHWPLREWDGFFRGAVHIHGHVHGNLPNSRRSVDVGVDSVGFAPITFAQIHARMQTLPELDFRGVETVPFETKP